MSNILRTIRYFTHDKLLFPCSRGGDMFIKRICYVMTDAIEQAAMSDEAAGGADVSRT